MFTGSWILFGYIRINWIGITVYKYEFSENQNKKTEKKKLLFLRNGRRQGEKNRAKEERENHRVKKTVINHL